MRRRLPRVNPGDILTAELLNSLFDEARRLNISLGPNLLMAETKTGVTLTALCLDQTFIKITGPAVETASGMQGYPWTLMIPVAAGGWEASLITGTADVDGSGVPEDDPAIESTGWCGFRSRPGSGRGSSAGGSAGRPTASSSSSGMTT
jgi:hypothetical protein